MPRNAATPEFRADTRRRLESARSPSSSLTEIHRLTFALWVELGAAQHVLLYGRSFNRETPPS